MEYEQLALLLDKYRNRPEFSEQVNSFEKQVRSAKDQYFHRLAGIYKDAKHILDKESGDFQ